MTRMNEPEGAVKQKLMDQGAASFDGQEADTGPQENAHETRDHDFAPLLTR